MAWGEMELGEFVGVVRLWASYSPGCLKSGHPTLATKRHCPGAALSSPSTQGQDAQTFPPGGALSERIRLVLWKSPESGLSEFCF